MNNTMRSILIYIQNCKRLTRLRKGVNKLAIVEYSFINRKTHHRKVAEKTKRKERKISTYITQTSNPLTTHGIYHKCQTILFKFGSGVLIILQIWNRSVIFSKQGVTNLVSPKKVGVKCILLKNKIQELVQAAVTGIKITCIGLHLQNLSIVNQCSNPKRKTQSAQVCRYSTRNFLSKTFVAAETQLV